jgi:hypothetical protein
MYFLQSGSGGFGGFGAFESLFLIAIIALIVYAIIKYNDTIDTVTNRGQTPFENLQFSTQDFYIQVEALIREKEIHNIKISRVYHAMYGILSGKREYLRVEYQKYFFDICAAPFARDFFVSYRQGTLKVAIRRKREKTFYEQDTENMFHATVLLCYNRAIEGMQGRKGIRPNELSLLQ